MLTEPRPWLPVNPLRTLVERTGTVTEVRGAVLRLGVVVLVRPGLLTRPGVRNPPE